MNEQSKAVLDYAARLLAPRAMSEKMLRDKLTAKNFPQEGIDLSLIHIWHAKGYGRYLKEVSYPRCQNNGARAIALSWGMEDDLSLIHI